MTLARRQILGGRYNVASAIVHALPDHRGNVRNQLAALPGVEIHAETLDGRFIVSVEDTGMATAGDTLIALHRLEGVVAATLVSHYETE